MKTYLVTGAAGFIGSHLVNALCQCDVKVFGVDNLNEYYSVQLKKARLKHIEAKNFTFLHLSITDIFALRKLFEQNEFDVVVNLAAQPGVRYSIEHSDICIENNIVGFNNILTLCVEHDVKHLLFASSSSVYGSNTNIPFAECDATDMLLSPYAVSKKANELLAYSYASTHRLPCSALRYFTVYGPWGRPDMAIFKFTESICNNLPIKLHNNGHMARNFTYIDDAIAATLLLIDRPPLRDENAVPYQVFNIAGDEIVSLLTLVEHIENNLEKKAHKHYIGDHIGEMLTTHADLTSLRNLSYEPKISFCRGCKLFVDWYLQHNRVSVAI